MQEFFVNKYLSLRLEDELTIIYVGKIHFLQCKYLLLNIESAVILLENQIHT